MKNNKFENILRKTIRDEILNLINENSDFESLLHIDKNEFNDYTESNKLNNEIKKLDLSNEEKQFIELLSSYSYTEELKYLKQAIKKHKNIFNKYTRKFSNLYMGIQFKPKQVVNLDKLKCHVVLQSIFEKAGNIKSTSMDLEQAKVHSHLEAKYGDETPVIVILKNYSGFPLGKISQYPSEQEVIVQINKFKVQNFKLESDNSYTITIQ